MGDFSVRPIQDKADRYRMYQYALGDIAAFEQMWKENAFVQAPIKIGAEQELCVVNADFAPAKSALQLLDAIDDPHYTNELGLFNLEINLDPEVLKSNCFSTVEQKLLDLLQKGKTAAKALDEIIVMTGILPTINPKHLQFEYMTPIPRYQTLSQMLYNIRGGEFEIYLSGVDDLIASLDSVLFEACNTSFQLHLQLKPDEFVDKHNWSQMIAGPVLSACVNSPLLFGRELWAESRIALFKQSLDTRSSKNHLRKKLPRVYFGNDWLKDSPVNLWKNELMRFPLLLTSDDLIDSVDKLNQGETPDLRAIRLHNGTTYTWNRLCYGPGKQAHLRIECRYLPAGPSVVDEIANFAFWVGLMKAIPEDWEEQMKKTPFKIAKENFIKAARTGLNSVFNWFGENIPAKNLLLDTLLPMAKIGLESCGVDDQDIAKYLGIIEKRVRKEQTGATWTVENFRAINSKYKSQIARQSTVAQMAEYQDQNTPVHEWDIASTPKYPLGAPKKQPKYTVAHLMSTDIFSVHEDASLDLVKSIMSWNNIHHLPVENHRGDLIGIITDGMLEQASIKFPNAQYAADIMLKKVISVERDLSIASLIDLLEQHKINGLPVTYKDRLIGMITWNDIKQIV